VLILSEFEKFRKKFLKKDYKFIRTYEKDFGKYMIGERKGGPFSSNKRILIYHFHESPTVEKFAKVVKDFEKAVLDACVWGDDYDIEGGYFIVHGSYAKEGFKLILDRVRDEIYELIKIVTLKEEKPKVPKKEVKPKKERAKPKAPEVKQLACALDETSSPGCAHHFGYLGERSKGEEIPDECITCEKTVECMLSKLKKSETAIKEIKNWYSSSTD